MPTVREILDCRSCLRQKIFPCVPACTCEFVSLIERSRAWFAKNEVRTFPLSQVAGHHFQLNENCMFLSLRDQMYLLSSVTFLLFISLKEAANWPCHVK